MKSVVRGYRCGEKDATDICKRETAFSKWIELDEVHFPDVEVFLASLVYE